MKRASQKPHSWMSLAWREVGLNATLRETFDTLMSVTLDRHMVIMLSSDNIVKENQYE